MQITRNSIETGQGPSDWFTGAVYIDSIAAPSEARGSARAGVHFTTGAHTAWHTHPNGQTIWVTEGVGLCQRRGGPIEVISPGDRVFFEPREDHWHGAAPNRFMTHVAMLEVDEGGNPATWGDHVTEDEYAAAPPQVRVIADARNRHVRRRAASSTESLASTRYRRLPGDSRSLSLRLPTLARLSPT